MAKFIDLTNKKFGRLTVLKKSCVKNKKIYWYCLCECGNIKEVAGTHLKSGLIKSCGCLLKEKNTKTFYKHGKSKDKIYRIYNHIKDRCYHKNDKSFKNYGGRGIKMCDEWNNDFMSFYNWAIENGYNEHLKKYRNMNTTIDRIDTNGNYEPSNCRWATQKQQANNTRRNKYITYDGITHTLQEWSRIVNISRNALSMRLKRGWTI